MPRFVKKEIEGRLITEGVRLTAQFISQQLRQDLSRFAGDRDVVDIRVGGRFQVDFGDLGAVAFCLHSH